MPFGPAKLAPYWDRLSPTSGPHRFHPYHPDSQPKPLYQPSTQSVRPLSAIAWRLQDERIKCDKDLGWNIDWAVAFLVDHLSEKKSPDAPEILKKLRISAASLATQGLSGEIPYRVFNKLDETLFAGHLKNAVFLDVGRLGPAISGATYTQGRGPNPNVKRVSIVLNSDILRHAKSRDIIACLIHHMIHAYFLITCGPQDEKEVVYGRLAHGFQFGKLMMTIKKLSAAYGKPLVPLDFGYTMDPYRHYSADDHCYSLRKNPRPSLTENWHCSHCYLDVDPISEADIQKWFGGACKPLYNLPETLRGSMIQVYNDRRHEIEAIPRGQATPSAASVEFLFHDQPFLVPGVKVDAFFTIARAFERGGCRYMKIHDDVSFDTFMRFLELLHTGAYGPDPQAVVMGGKQGPPVIRPPSSSEAYLVTNVRIWKMGCLMGFDELKIIALERMYRPAVTHEDPVAVLNEIYKGGEPDHDLKVWVGKFLVRTPVGDRDWMPNLIKLECDMLPYKATFISALEANGSLENDVKKAREQLVAAGHVSPSRGLSLYTGSYAQPITPPLAPLGMGMGLPMPASSMGLSSLGLPWNPNRPGAGPDPDSLFNRNMGFGEAFEDRWF